MHRSPATHSIKVQKWVVDRDLDALLYKEPTLSLVPCPCTKQPPLQPNQLSLCFHHQNLPSCTMASQSDHHLAKIGREGFDLIDELRRNNGSSASTKSTAPRQAHVHKVVHTPTTEAVVEPPITAGVNVFSVRRFVHVSYYSQETMSHSYVRH
ncbi:hypothetical protein H6P81_018862 [Aristolochia fimbriata]|uniref:Uncharacterized protein n=1 Tax=Aristolochia fimbriata TaxID=158543 RepID=A0AAV7E357_ARIFI|nr:hypothetical protein H6P81_018862 [Aristolochia fimbriata]